MSGKSFFIDLTKCTACRGCQVACKQWNKLPAEQTRNHGSHQNPMDVSAITYKTVHMKEVADDQGFMAAWLFFPEQCRHCTEPPCKMTADAYDDQAILQDEATGAITFTERTKDLPDFDEIREACPYNIPRQDAATRVMTKSDFSEAGPFNEIVVMGVLAVRLQGLNKTLEWDGEKMEFTNINDNDSIKICVEDHFNITDGHPTFDRKYTDPINAKQFAAEMIQHTYRNGWSLPEMPA